MDVWPGRFVVHQDLDGNGRILVYGLMGHSCTRGASSPWVARMMSLGSMMSITPL